MSWSTIIWSMIAGICLAMAWMQLLGWLRSRDDWSRLIFGIAAMAAGANALAELALMRAESPAHYTELLGYIHIPLFVLVVSLAWFLRIYTGAGRLWLLWTITGLRFVVLMLALNIGSSESLSYSTHIINLSPTTFLGESILVPFGNTVAPVSHIARLSMLLFVIFILDVSVSVWRGGDRRRALVIAVTFTFASILGAASSRFLYHTELAVPFTTSLPFLLILAGMMNELSRDLVRVTSLDRGLRESEERMRLATSSGDIGLWEWDIARDEMWATNLVRRRYHVDDDERLDLERFLRAVHPEDKERVRQALQKALEDVQQFDLEYRVVSPDGQTRWVVVRGEVQRDARGTAILVRGASHDTTARKEADLALEENERHLRTTFAHAAEGLAHVMPDGRFLRVNQKFCSILGHKEAELRGRSVQDIVGADILAAAVPPVQRLLRGEIATFSVERLYRNRANDKIWVSLTASLVRNDAGEPDFFVIVVEDTTERKDLEAELERRRSELAHVQRMSTVNQLSTTLAHELSQPLGAILRNAEAAGLFLQQKSPDLDEIRSIIEDIKNDNQRAAAVISGMRSLMRRRETAHESISVRHFISQVEALLHSECQARHTELRFEVADDLPFVWGEPAQLQQVVLNLAMNALDAMDGLPEERRQLEITVRPAGAESVMFAVSDTGPGIPDGLVNDVFQPFQTTKSKGLGLGLAICETIVESHAGRIWAENNPDVGATFRFTLGTTRPHGGT